MEKAIRVRVDLDQASQQIATSDHVGKWPPKGARGIAAESRGLDAGSRLVYVVPSSRIERIQEGDRFCACFRQR
jgi:hypothetical protein